MILVIAALDPSGGAGILNDVKTLTLLEEDVCMVQTGIIIENNKEVRKIYEEDVNIVEEQLDIILNEQDTDVIKIGALLSDDIAEIVYKKLKPLNKKIIIDTPLKSSVGPEIYKGKLDPIIDIISISYITTPNQEELKVLTNKIDIESGAEYLINKGAKYVLVTGIDKAVDILFWKDDILKKKSFSKVEIKKDVHGTGCMYSSLISSFISKGYTVENSIKNAKEYMYEAIKNAYEVNNGLNVLSFTSLGKDEREVLQSLKNVQKLIEDTENFGLLIPEIQSNLVYALPNAEDVNQIAAFPGRIVKIQEKAITIMNPKFGASSHVARFLLTIKKYNPKIRSAMNIKYNEKIEKFCEKEFLTSYYSRKEEDKNMKKKEDSTMQWGAKMAIDIASKKGYFPEIIFNYGDFGKEPTTILLGKDPKEVVEKTLKILIGTKEV